MADIVAQRSCVLHEVSKRKFIYAKQVRKGKMTQKQADTQISIMESVGDTLETVRRIVASYRPDDVPSMEFNDAMAELLERAPLPAQGDLL